MKDKNPDFPRIFSMPSFFFPTKNISGLEIKQAMKFYKILGYSNVE